MKPIIALLILFGVSGSCSRVDDSDIQREEDMDRHYERDSFPDSPFEDELDVNRGKPHEADLESLN